MTELYEAQDEQKEKHHKHLHTDTHTHTRLLFLSCEDITQTLCIP